MRITNNMMTLNSMRHINNSKLEVDRMNNQMATGKKISRSSQDPIIAIRALRLRGSLSELGQFFSKNIPDAASWLELTEDALVGTRSMLEKIRGQAVKGANDSLRPEDRNAILKELQGLRDQIYSEGNADRTGRTLFTGFKTNSQLTFQAGDPDLNATYRITEDISFQDISEKRYFANQVSVPSVQADVDLGVNLNAMPQSATHQRIRLSYDKLDADSVNISYTMADGTPLTVTNMSYEDWANAGYPKPDSDEIFFIPETGELILSDKVADDLRSNRAVLSVTYEKSEFKEGDLRPEHYFNSIRNPGEANEAVFIKENQEIAFDIAFNQSLVVNTQASNVFKHAIGRDIDELANAVQAAINAHEKVSRIEDMLKQDRFADAASQEKLGEWLEAAKREADLMDDNMQKLFTRAIGSFDKHISNVNLAIADVGSKVNRLEMTKNRVENQQMAFEKLRSDNEDRELSDIILDFATAQAAYQAALMAAAKANQQTLLNFL